MGQSVEAQIFLHLGPCGGEHGADQPLPHRADAGQPPQAAAPEQVEQDGLSIVIRGVGGGDQGSAQLCRGLPEEGVTHLPGGLLQASSQLSGLGSHVAPAHIEGDTGQLMSVHLGGAAPLGDEAADECFVPPGFLPPQLMVVVGGSQTEPHPLPEQVQPVQEIHRVRPPGAGAQHRAPRRDHSVGLDEGVQPMERAGMGHGQYSSWVRSMEEKVVYSGSHWSSTVRVSPCRFLAMMHSARLWFSDSFS